MIRGGYTSQLHAPDVTYNRDVDIKVCPAYTFTSTFQFTYTLAFIFFLAWELSKCTLIGTFQNMRVSMWCIQRINSYQRPPNPLEKNLSPINVLQSLPYPRKLYLDIDVLQTFEKKHCPVHRVCKRSCHYQMTRLLQLFGAFGAYTYVYIY